MARQIDLDQLMKYPLRRGSEHCDGKNADPRFLNGVESILEWAQTLPTLTPPNEPLTVEKLENMEDTTPVWWDQINSWVLVYKGNLTTWSGKHLYAKGSNGKFYRRPPEGEEDT